MSIDELIDELAAEEEKFLGTRFFAPLLPVGGGGKGGGAASRVRVRIAGIVCELAVEGEVEPGFAVLEATGPQTARVVGRATRRQVADYLRLFAQVRLVLAEQREPQGVWLALPAHGGTQRVQLEGIVPLQLVEGAGRFDTVNARFDGALFWFEGRDRRRDRSVADYLRRQLVKLIDPDELKKKGLTPAERRAYAFAVARELERGQRGHEARLRQALAHAGGVLESFVEARDHYRVSWVVDGRRHTSAIGKRDLTVMVAGICLAGQDRRFDLASLVGVMRERGARGAARVGDGALDVDRYFEIHPEDD